MVIAQLMSPVAPFFSDVMYGNLSGTARARGLSDNSPMAHESIHLTDITLAEEDVIDRDLEQRMDYAQRISSLVLSLRKKEMIRVRQPLKRILLPVIDKQFERQVDSVRDLILSEVNVKDIEYIADAEGFLNKKAKPNFKTLGRRLGKNMKPAAEIIQGLDQEAIAEIERTNAYNLSVNGESFDLTLEDFEIVTEDIPGWQVASDGPLLVAVDISLDENLLAEGFARDLVNRIQNLRKQKDFNVTDRIDVSVQENPDVRGAVEMFADYIKGETLADTLAVKGKVSGDEVEWVDGKPLNIEVSIAG